MLMVWMGPRRSQVAFWSFFPQSDFKKKPTGKSTGGCRDLQEDAESSFGGFEGGKVDGKGS